MTKRGGKEDNERDTQSPIFMGVLVLGGVEPNEFWEQYDALGTLRRAFGPGSGEGSSSPFSWDFDKTSQ